MKIDAFPQDSWICEEHPDQSWPHGDCAGPGTLRPELAHLNDRPEAETNSRDDKARRRSDAKRHPPALPSLEPPRELASAWTLEKRGYRAKSRLVEHPLGVEVRIEINIDVLRTQVCRSNEAAGNLAADWRELMIGKGWTLPQLERR